MAGPRDRVDRAEHRSVIKALADFPRLLFRRHAILQVTAGHIEPPSIAVHVLERLFGTNVGAARLQRRNQLDFVVIVLGKRGIWMIGDRSGGDVLDRVSRLLTEEWRFAVRIGA